jgi:hypothetical protein
MADVLDRLAKQTGMKVIYDGAPPRQMISVALEGRTPAEAVLGILEGQGLNYLLVMDATGTRVQTLMMAGSAPAGAPGPAGAPSFNPVLPRPQPPMPVAQPPQIEPEPEQAPDPDIAEEAQSEEEAAAENVERQMNGEAGAPTEQPKEDKPDQPAAAANPPGFQPFSPFAPPNAAPPPLTQTEQPTPKNPKEQPPKEQ